MLSLLIALVTSAPVTAPSGPALVVVTEQTGLTQSEVVDLGETLARLLREGSVRIPLAPGELPVRLTAKDLPACQRLKGKGRQRCIGALGKQLGAATVVAIEGGKLLDEYTVIVDLLDAEDGRVLFNRDTSFKSGGRKALERALKPIAAEISKLIALPEEPPAETPPPPPPKEQGTGAPPTHPVTPLQDGTASNPPPPPVKPPEPQPLSPPPPPLPPPPMLRAWSWLPAVAGVGLAAGGGFALKQAKDNYDALATGSGSADRARAYRDEGKNQQRLGIALVGAGAVGLAAAGVMFFADKPLARGMPALTLGSGDVGLTFTGTWP